MSFEFVGLENLPNTYIKKISISDDSDKAFVLSIDTLLIDQSTDGSFVWSTDPLLFDYLRIGLVATSNLQLINKISEGLISPHPSVLSKSDYMEGTEIDIFSPKQMKLVRDSSTKRYHKRSSFKKPSETSDVTLFAFSYIDAKELSRDLRIALTGPLMDYCGPITSENIIVGGSIQETSYLYEKRDGSVWSGPVHQAADGTWMGGSFHRDLIHPVLTRKEVLNTKIIDKRSTAMKLRGETKFKDKSMFSTLSESFNSNADFMGIFSFDLRTALLSKTRYGRKMYDLSDSLFNSFARSVVINSVEVRRQQVRTKKVLNKLGTLKYDYDLIGSYKSVGSSVESSGTLASTESLSQIFIMSDPLIKTYQFVDTEMTEKTRGEFKYEAIITIVDKSKLFLESLVDQMELNISNLKTQREILYRNSKYDKDSDSLRPTVIVPSVFMGAIDNYYQNLSLVVSMTEEEKNQLIKNKKSIFTNQNYTNKDCEIFIAEYSKLSNKFRARFDIGKKSYNIDQPVIPKNSIGRTMLTITNVFDSIIKFDNVMSSYDIVGRSTNKTILHLTREEYLQRCNSEVDRFFDKTKSLVSTDIVDLDKEDMEAIRDLDSSKLSFLSPKSFKFGDKTKDLTSFKDLDIDGISSIFVEHLVEKRINPSFTSSPKRKDKNKISKSPSRKRAKVGKVGINFKRPPLKINNLKKEEYLEVEKYLGKNSEMINVETNLDQPTTPTQAEQISRKSIISTAISKSRSKKHFDLQEKDNIFEKFKSSPKFDRSKLKSLPLPIKSLINSRSTAAKNNVLAADVDVTKDIETRVPMEMIFHSSQKIEFLNGFEKDVDGSINLSRPIWKMIEPADLENNQRLMCRMTYAEIPELGVSPASEFKLLAQNSTFIISDEPLQTRVVDPIISEPPLEIDEALEEVGEMTFASSNYVKQNIARKKQVLDIEQESGANRNVQNSRY